MSPWLRYGFLFVLMTSIYIAFGWSMSVGNSRSTSAACAVAVLIVAAIGAYFLDRRFEDGD